MTRQFQKYILTTFTQRFFRVFERKPVQNPGSGRGEMETGKSSHLVPRMCIKCENYSLAKVWGVLA